MTECVVCMCIDCTCIVPNVNFSRFGSPKCEFRNVPWAFDGMDVWVILSRISSVPDVLNLIRCKVACAAGDHIRVMNENHGIDTWKSISVCYVPSDHEWPATKVMET